MNNILTEITGYLTGGITEYAKGFGTGLKEMVTSIFLEGTGDTQKLSTFGAICIIFAGLSLAIGLSRFVLEWVSGFGK